MTSPDALRAAFEQWVTAKPYEMPVDRLDAYGAEYRLDEVELAWEAWQAALAHAAPTPEPVDRGISLYRCRTCNARWLFWQGSISGMKPGLWSLLDAHQTPGSCCDNAPMGDQMELLRDIVPQNKAWKEPVDRAARNIVHCDTCGCDWIDNGINPIGCPYCNRAALIATVERLPRCEPTIVHDRFYPSPVPRMSHAKDGEWINRDHVLHLLTGGTERSGAS